MRVLLLLRRAASLAASFRLLVLGLALVALSPPASRAVPSAIHHGRWTPSRSTEYTAIHLILLPNPSSGGADSKILLWQESHVDHGEEGEFGGKVWSWTPAVQDNCASFPDDNIEEEADLTEPEYPIFCAGHVQLSGADGKLLVAGGHEFGEAGANKSTIFDPSDNSWSAPTTLNDFRWYPSLVQLGGTTGGIGLFSGSSYHHLWAFGGKESDDTHHPELNRFGSNLNGVWDSAIEFTGTAGLHYPEPRTGHAAARAMHIFGGLDENGDLHNDQWVLLTAENPSGGGPTYFWEHRTTATTPPKERRRATAIVPYGDTLWAYGGLGVKADEQDTVYADVWRMYYDDVDDEWKWQQVTPSGTGPGNRYGHTAVFDNLRNRILVFGGADAAGAAATDNTVYALDLKTSPPTWSTPTLRNSGNPKPTPRLGHNLVLDPLIKTRSTTDGHEYRAVLFGGQDQDNGGGYLNDAWHLWIEPESGSLEWKQITIDSESPVPAARAWAGACIDGALVRLMVNGGEVSGGTADGKVFGLSIPHEPAGYDGTAATWTELASQSFGVSGHTLVRENVTRFARNPEKITSPYTTWTPLTESDVPHLQEWYPFMFVMPNGNLFYAGPSTAGESYATFQVDVSTGAWSQFPSASGSGFKGGSAVVYRPGRVMKVGSRDTEDPGTTAAKTTKTINLNAGTPSWQSSPDMKHGRVFHNLTLLPTGEVLATGGAGTVNDAGANPVQAPEIWLPDYNNWEGYWYRGADDSLSANPFKRDYHSTALLLPDARVVTAGGNKGGDETVRLNMYCPPYLFKSTGSYDLAPRPVIAGAPLLIDWGKLFTVCVSDTAGIGIVSLIRPGSVTHGYDQNQRFVPLTFTPAGSGTQADPYRLLVNGPANANDAPPGWYLLFIVGGKDGSGRYPYAPSIARWVQLGSGLDLCDTTPGDSLHAVLDVITPSSAYFFWTATADDKSLSASGPATLVDLRKKASAFVSESAWNSASQCANETPNPPEAVGSSGEGSFTGLSSNTWYYFSLRSKDDNDKISAISQVKYKTASGGGGGGSHARESDEFETASVEPVTSTGAVSVSPVVDLDRSGMFDADDASTGVLVVKTVSALSGGWTVLISRESGSGGLGSSDAGKVVTQDPDGSEGWKSRSAMSATAQEEAIGLCAFRDGARAVVPGDYQLSQLAQIVEAGGARCELTQVMHSTQGTLSGDELAGATIAGLQVGESLALTYEANAEAAEPSESWYLLTTRRTAGATRARQPQVAPEAEPGYRFTLQQNEPNPFRGATTIRFELAARGAATLEVFDLQGRRLRTLESRSLEVGSHQTTWDHRDESGRQVSPGVYIYRLRAGSQTAERKMTLIP